MIRAMASSASFIDLSFCFFWKQIAGLSNANCKKEIGFSLCFSFKWYVHIVLNSDTVVFEEKITVFVNLIV